MGASVVDLMTNTKLLFLVPLCLLVGAMAQEPKPTPPKPPTIEDLQKQVSDRDAQIAQLQQQVTALNGNLAVLNQLYGACYQGWSADKAKLPPQK